MDTAREDNATEKRRGDSAGPPSVPALAEFRNRARQLVRIQRERVQRVESTLANQLSDLLQEFQQDRGGGQELESEQQQTIEDLQQARRELEETLDEARIALSNAAGEQQELRAQRDDLQTRLQTAERGLEAAGSNQPEEMDDLRRRFEMAVQEVRELKAQNAELTDQLTAQQSSDSAAAPASAGGFDWEEQKLRLMAQLDSDFDDSNPQQREEKLTVEGTIRITDEVVAQKEREIAELTELLEDRPDSPSSEDATPAVVSDEQTQKEREALQQMQQEWREKLRQAEVDISVERAKIARERVELEERLRTLETERSELAANRNEEAATDQSKGRPRGRWLTRLGLNEDKN